MLAARLAFAPDPLAVPSLKIDAPAPWFSRWVLRCILDFTGGERPIAYGKNQFERPKTHSRLTMSTSLRNIGANALSILTSDVMNRATSFVVYAMVARKLGAFEFGQMSLALSLFYVFQVSAVAGLKILIVRDVAKDQSRTRLYFKNGCAIVAASSFASVVLLSLFIRLMHYSPAT